MFKYVKALRKHSAHNSMYFNILDDPWNKVESAVSMSGQNLKSLQREIGESIFSQQLPSLIIAREGKKVNLKIFSRNPGCSWLLPVLGTQDRFLEEEWAC